MVALFRIQFKCIVLTRLLVPYGEAISFNTLMYRALYTPFAPQQLIAIHTMPGSHISTSKRILLVLATLNLQSLRQPDPCR